MGIIKEIKNRCVIIAGGSIPNVNLLKQNINENDFIICADSGYYHALNADLIPDLLVGDFDSFTDELPSNIEIIKLPCEKDDTDLHHAVSEGLSRGFKEFALFGAFGSRPDHSIASLYTLYHLLKSNANGKIFGDDFQVQIIENTSLKIAKNPNFYVSIFPFGGVASGVTLDGFKYPLENVQLCMSNPIGISNEIDSDIATITIQNGILVIMIINKNL
ncbi:MAG: thiamine diphosphokinase [Oscillospiraceae bacterium]|nr:thiamine diphosphokinase [Oscillospiraceae bacterium]